jgi:hypothetical protein
MKISVKQILHGTVLLHPHHVYMGQVTFSLCSSFLDQNIESLKMLSGMINYCYFSHGDDSSLLSHINYF